MNHLVSRDDHSCVRHGALETARLLSSTGSNISSTDIFDVPLIPSVSSLRSLLLLFTDCPISLGPQSRVGNSRQYAATCFWRLLDHTLSQETTETGTGTCVLCGWPFCHLFLGAVLLSVPTLGQVCQQERLQVGVCHTVACVHQSRMSASIQKFNMNVTVLST